MVIAQVRNENSNPWRMKKLGKMIGAAKKPVMVVGSQAMLPGGALHAEMVASAIRFINMPVFLGNL